jgi:NADH-quinone oxidoreductase subunit F
MQLTPENEARLDEILKCYAVKRSALLPALRLVERQQGWIDREAIEYLAGRLALTAAQVHDTASFYSMVRLQPEGKRLIEICTTLSCALGGGEELLEHTCKRLGVPPGGTSADGEFTVRGVECLAACGGAPAVQVDGAWLEHATAADIDRVIAGETVRRSFEWPKSPGDPILLQNVWKEGSTSLAVYRQGGGYSRLGEWLRRPPETIVEEVKKSNLRGRGGAGFPTGVKWGFLPKDDSKPRYLCVNADESEPGTYKDRVIIERDPHRLIEAIVVSCHAIRARTAYVYIRGEFHEGAQILEAALAEARQAGLVGADILGSGVSVEIHVHRGAGSYECGEETALLNSLEGQRGQPRIRPPFPAVVGLYGCPTIINNVETLVSVPLILDRGAAWFASYGTERNGGPKLYSVSGQVKRPGSYEAAMGKLTLRELIFDEGYGQGIRDGRRLKAVIPGGSSTPVLTAAEIDVAMSFDSLAQAGSMLGSAGTIVMDDSTCMVWAARNLMHFYQHESCGKCTPCREGTGWMLRLLTRIEAGEAEEKDLDLLWKVTDSISGKTVCPFGDAAIAAPQSTLTKFRQEYLYHVREKRCWKTVAPTFEEAQSRSGGRA